jgi:hypothetical protein
LQNSVRFARRSFRPHCEIRSNSARRGAKLAELIVISDRSCAASRQVVTGRKRAVGDSSRAHAVRDELVVRRDAKEQSSRRVSHIFIHLSSTYYWPAASGASDVAFKQNRHFVDKLGERLENQPWFDGANLSNAC